MKRRRCPLIESLESRSLLSGLSSSLTTDQAAYKPGQPVTMTFQETNTSDQPVTVEVGPSRDGFDVSRGSKLIWQSNAGINPMFITAEVLQPGQSLTLSATWKGLTNNGSTVANGTYTITNQLTSDASTTITIANAPAQTPTPSTAPPASVTSTSANPTSSPSVSNPTTGSEPITLSVAPIRPVNNARHPVWLTVRLKNHGSTPFRLSRRTAVRFDVLDGSKSVGHLVRILRHARRILRPGHSLAFRTRWNPRRLHLPVSTSAQTYNVQAIAAGASGSTTFQIIQADATR